MSICNQPQADTAVHIARVQNMTSKETLPTMVFGIWMHKEEILKILGKHCNQILSGAPYLVQKDQGHLVTSVFWPQGHRTRYKIIRGTLDPDHPPKFGQWPWDTEHWVTPWWKGVQVHTMQPCNYISSKPQKPHPIGLIGLLWQFLQLQTSYSLGTLYEGPKYEYKICKCKWVMDAQTYMGRCYHLVQFNLADHLKQNKDSS